MIMPVFRHINHNTEESCTLTVLRDALLPKLLSGEIKVKDGQRVVGVSHG